jgi:hypothetical protein
MSDATQNQDASRSPELSARRRELRTLLLAAADAARQGRRLQQAAVRISRPIGRAVRDRVSTLLNNAAA